MVSGALEKCAPDVSYFLPVLEGMRDQHLFALFCGIILISNVCQMMFCKDAKSVMLSLNFFGHKC